MVLGSRRAYSVDPDYDLYSGSRKANHVSSMAYDDYDTMSSRSRNKDRRLLDDITTKMVNNTFNQPVLVKRTTYTTKPPLPPCYAGPRGVTRRVAASVTSEPVSSYSFRASSVPPPRKIEYDDEEYNFVLPRRPAVERRSTYSYRASSEPPVARTHTPTTALAVLNARRQLERVERELGTVSSDYPGSTGRVTVNRGIPSTKTPPHIRSVVAPQPSFDYMYTSSPRPKARSISSTNARLRGRSLSPPRVRRMVDDEEVDNYLNPTLHSKVQELLNVPSRAPWLQRSPYYSDYYPTYYSDFVPQTYVPRYYRQPSDFVPQTYVPRYYRQPYTDQFYTGDLASRNNRSYWGGYPYVDSPYSYSHGLGTQRVRRANMDAEVNSYLSDSRRFPRYDYMGPPRLSPNYYGVYDYTVPRYAAPSLYGTTYGRTLRGSWEVDVDPYYRYRRSLPYRYELETSPMTAPKSYGSGRIRRAMDDAEVDAYLTTEFPRRPTYEVNQRVPLTTAHSYSIDSTMVQPPVTNVHVQSVPVTSYNLSVPAAYRRRARSASPPRYGRVTDDRDVDAYLYPHIVNRPQYEEVKPLRTPQRTILVPTTVGGLLSVPTHRYRARSASPTRRAQRVVALEDDSLPHDRPLLFKRSGALSTVSPRGRSYSVPSVRAGAAVRAANRSRAAEIEAQLELHTPLVDTPPTSLAALRSKCNDAKNKLDAHRLLVDRYLPIYMGPENDVAHEIDYKFGELCDRMPSLDPYRPNQAGIVAANAVQLNGPSRPYKPADLPPRPSSSYTPRVSETRRKIREVLCHTKKDPRYYD